jgi:hypothetical protein
MQSGKSGMYSSVAEAMRVYMGFMKALLTYTIARLCDFCYSWVSYS